MVNASLPNYNEKLLNFKFNILLMFSVPNDENRSLVLLKLQKKP